MTDLLSTLSYLFGMNWNTDYERDLIIQHQSLTSIMFLWLNRSKFLQPGSTTRWKTFPEEWKVLQLQINVG